jgi:fermentation-respiration switch protein FrsA (DUF1100 family)
MTRRRPWVIASAGAVTAGVAAFLAVGHLLVMRSNRPIASPPPHLHPERVVIPSPSGERLAAWLFIPASPRAAVLVLHGVRANRSDMVGRAELLFNAGFAVLTPDLQAHGESSGRRITYGHLEARDAEGAVAYLRQRFPRLRIGGIGVSLGGAALVLAGTRLDADALVLEAVFPTITDALDNRLRIRLGPLADLLTPLLMTQLEPRLGVTADALRPIVAIRDVRCPILIVSGTDDVHTTVSQTKALFAAANPPKELWLVPGAAHVDLIRHDPRGYADHVLGFLDRHLGEVLSNGTLSPPVPAPIPTPPFRNGVYSREAM